MKSELVYEGMSTSGFAGIDGKLMRDENILLALVWTVDNEGAVLVHPDLDPEKIPHLVSVIDELNRQAKVVLSGMATGDGEVH